MGKQEKAQKYFADQALTATLANVQLPDRIKCKDCKKTKSHSCFANTRLNDFKRAIQKGEVEAWSSVRLITCMMCTGSPQMEFECQGCDKWKARACFSKTQLRNPDNAYCQPCMADRNKMEPGDTDSSGGGGSGSDDEDDESDDATYDGGVTDVRGTLPSVSGLSISGGGTSTSGGIAVNSADAASTRSYATTAASRNLNKTSTGGVTAAPPTASALRSFNPPHLKNGPGSVISTTSTKTTTTYDGNNSGFAKVRAAPKKHVDSDAAKRVRAMDKAKEDEITVASSESDSD